MNHNGSYVLTVTSNPFPKQALTLSLDIIVQDVGGSPANPAQLNQINIALSITSIVFSLILLVVLCVVFARYFRRRIPEKKPKISTAATGPLGMT